MRFRDLRVPRQEGERARLRVVQGPDFGTTYVLASPRVTIGRGEECEVMISDLKSSRKHAELSETPRGWTVKDLGSSNGVTYKGEAVPMTNLRSGETFTIGETVMEFLVAQASTRILLAPPNARSIQTTQRNQQKLMGVAGEKPKGNPLVLSLVVIGAAVMFLVDVPSSNQNTQGIKDERAPAAIDPKQYLPDVITPDVKKSADNFFRKGFREYRERNYLRAMRDFENALQTDPTHRLAQLYLDNCRRTIKDEVARLMDSGRRSFETGKLRDAKGSYEAVMRLLFREQQSSVYIEASEQHKRVLESMKGDAS